MDLERKQRLYGITTISVREIILMFSKLIQVHARIAQVRAFYSQKPYLRNAITKANEWKIGIIKPKIDDEVAQIFFFVENRLLIKVKKPSDTKFFDDNFCA